MYIEIACPTCKKNEWVDIKLNILESSEQRNEETIYALSLKGIEVFDIISEDEMIKRIKTQLSKNSRYPTREEMEKAFIECFGVAPRYTHDLLWRLRVPRTKTSIINKTIEHIVWFLDGIRAEDHKIYLISGIIIMILFILLWHFVVSHSFGF